MALVGKGIATDRCRRHGLPLASAGPADVPPGAGLVTVYVRGGACEHSGDDARGHHRPATSEQLDRPRG